VFCVPRRNNQITTATNTINKLSVTKPSQAPPQTEAEELGADGVRGADAACSKATKEKVMPPIAVAQKRKAFKLRRIGKLAL
jgi:hypothetical protein